MSKAVTQDELLEAFIDSVKLVCRYWANAGETNDDVAEGVAFSILNIIDGTSGNFPGSIDLVVRSCSEDKQYAIDNGDDWIEDGAIINQSILLHEALLQGDKK